MSASTLLKWAKEHEDYAIELRRVAGTDRSRRPVALAAAKIHEQRAREYRESARRQQEPTRQRNDVKIDERLVDLQGTPDQP